MNEFRLLLPILIPIAGAVAIWFLRGGLIWRSAVIEAVVLLNAAASWQLILYRPDAPLPLFSFSESFSLTLRLDGLGSFFLGMASTLWIFVSIYAFSYMKDEAHQRMFFSFFVMSLAATDGIALSGNLITLYFFYEMLTVVTIPLVMHGCGREDMRAGYIYAAYQLGGAAFAFVGIVYLTMNFGGGAFVLGGYIDGGSPTLPLVWLVMLLGFGVKACIFPFYKWLPTASVAPTPVTALLHAAAVVKAGIFAIVRLSYFSFSPDSISKTDAADVGFMLACFTAVFAAVMAVREGHFKRRLAYSTVSNLSYILIGVLSFTPAGLAAGLCHMLFHAIIKMNGFLSCGSFMKMSGKSTIYELDGMGKRMPATFACFTVSALALSGVPLTNGFVSKWMLLSSMPKMGSGALAAVGMGALLISSLLCAVYMMTPAIRAWFLRGGGNESCEAPLGMTAPMAAFAAASVALGIFSQPIVNLCVDIATGAF